MKLVRVCSVLLLCAPTACGPQGPLPPPPRCPPLASLAPPPAATSAPPAADASAPDVPDDAIDDDDLSYEGCSDLRRAGTNALGLAPGTTVSGWLWPELCGRVLGWAGMGTSMNGYGFAFSRDGTRFVSCGLDAECEVIDLGTGHVTERVAPTWGADGPGARPVTQTPPIKSLLDRLGAATEGAFPHASDILVSWILEDGGRALVVTFVERATGVERAVLQFPRVARASQLAIVLERLWLSPNGGVLAARVATGQGGSGVEVGLVNVHAEAAALFRQVARERPDLEKVELAKATAADAAARKVARMLP